MRIRGDEVGGSGLEQPEGATPNVGSESTRKAARGNLCQGAGTDQVIQERGVLLDGDVPLRMVMIGVTPFS